ncbi:MULTISPECIES: LysR family transcriptional regulator [unclassified Rhizobium]|jgi:DNA-binding transcriptional LysR family regulator|uniref:LysR family transcriptional regulator n=1 Tax=unclassified Rhizobium TaxID=2613769 RepID=UPI001A98F1F1|nr:MULTISPECIES: LysR family transcriptional regulator [unclassified Rhizobium]MBX5157550.1 LysR family transcriptional regulator [Rhizobium sp. NZLR8]MBX5195697.1 LysR family transcriptional regulator [Rhizobium sp. NZLR10]MBX5202433.1 LysR family transcriptional regulator [Rhizobium sp. NZLR1]QSZ22630.1 LysR family transcriptional regulator [Rhizobium sp. NZLR1]
MKQLHDLEAYVAIVEYHSLTAAARELGKPLQSISRSLAALEQEVGVVLIHRSTRRLVPSEAGDAFYRRIKPAVEAIREGVLEATDRRLEPKGLLRIGAPVLFGPDFIVPMIADYMRRFRDVDVDLQLSDRFVDLSDERLDLVVRIGDLPDSSLQAKRLGALRRVVFASPGYLLARGRPASPKDLAAHDCLVRTVDRSPGEWVFQDDGKRRTIKVGGSFKSNSMTALYAAAVAGLGVGYSPLWQVKHLVDEGKLEVLLKEYEPAPVPIHALWQENRLPPAKIRSFLDVLSQNLQLDSL